MSLRVHLKGFASHSPFSTHYLAALISAVHLIIRLLKHTTEARCYKAKRPFLHVIAVDSKLFITFNPHEYAIGEFLIISKAFERFKFASAHCPCFEVLALIMPTCPVERLELVICHKVIPPSAAPGNFVAGLSDKQDSPPGALSLRYRVSGNLGGQ